ncbi:hypothetical protein DFH29DRAFT_873992 [Suillus ampliporus]|nr:hypothetical protein DFH29DRAFT_873992 [Suillus ampliporus]
MPRALLVSEIFSNIISYVGTHVPMYTRGQMYNIRRDGPTGLSRMTLFALALTCRAFSEQALDALWETITSIDRLLQCAGIILAPKKLPQDDDDDCIVPTESQLAIISRYAHRVRFLTMHWGMEDPMSPRHVQSFLKTLVDSSKILMPNLRGLHVASSSFLHLVPPLLGPRLQHLTIYTDYEEDNEEHVLQRPVLDKVLRSLPSSCPLLESFKVYTATGRRLEPQDVPSIAPLLSHPILNLQRLHTVVSPTITKDALTHLPSSLTSIETHLPTGSDLEDIFGSSRGPFLFENLGSVDWWIKEWRDIEDFIRLWPCKLTSMSLRSNTDTVKFDPGLLQVLLDSLHTREPFRHLQCIHLLESHACPFTFTTKVITIDTIRPLFYLRHLKVVDINTKSCIDIDEFGLDEIVDAWPCLEVLLLNERHGWHVHSSPGVTLRGVVGFIGLCPHLTKLCIGITLIDVDEDFDLDMNSILDLEPRRGSDTLKYLLLRYPRAEERIREHLAVRLGMLIEKLFPRVAPFSIYNRYSQYSEHDHW